MPGTQWEKCVESITKKHAASTCDQTGLSEGLSEKYNRVRNQTEMLCNPLEPEDYVVQTMDNVSPTKWHLAHTSWFFETFILDTYIDHYVPKHPRYAYLFNSYYVQAGERHCRAKRGYISRPTVSEVYEYRDYVNQKMSTLFNNRNVSNDSRFRRLVEIGLNHEQQHQELMLTDIKHVFSMNPLYPAYQLSERPANKDIPPMQWVPFEEGIYEIGYAGEGFHYDNESPRHKQYLQPYLMANRLVTNEEFLEFIDDGGYDRPELWLSDGWAERDRQSWKYPYYWEKRDGEYWMITLQGPRKIELSEPVCHISHYEADAYARWNGKRLPTEAEWEIASLSVPVEGHFSDSGYYHPISLEKKDTSVSLMQMFGNTWEWTQSAYLPYPGYKTPEGALGEYNGKFMANQIILRGGSCATPQDHIRPTYRNFFHPDSRWQFTGIRLADDQ